MKLKPDRPALRLRRIPINTFIHTPTEAEAKELLAILHENGFKWCSGNALTAYTGWESYREETCYYLALSGVEYACKACRIKDGDTILTLAEFKERYVLNEDNFAKSEEKKPQPEFKVGDRVWAKIYHDQPPFLGTVTFIRKDKDFEVDIDYFKNQINKQVWCCRASDLEPYAKSETKPTEDMETKDEAKELSLCELLKGHEGETFFSLAYGEVKLDEIRCGTQRGDSPDFLCVRATSFDSGAIIVNPNGKLRNAGVVDLVPSRALYEQYPLDPYTAWMKWKNERKFILQICYAPLIPDDIPLQAQQTVMANLNFRTPADREKCIEVIDAFLKQIHRSKSGASLCEEIKAIIEKYSKE